MKVLFMNFIVSQRVSKAKANLNPPNNKVGTSLVVQMVKNPPAMQETWVWFLGQEGSLEKELATRNSILALENFKDRGAWQATVHGVTKSRTWLSNFTSLHFTSYPLPCVFGDALVCHSTPWLYSCGKGAQELKEQVIGGSLHLSAHSQICW